MEISNRIEDKINDLIKIVIGLCIDIHSKIGPGCFEKVYEEILYHELINEGLNVKRQLLLPIDYKSLHINNAYKIDLRLENSLVLELKSVFPLPPVYFKQVQTQLSLIGLKNGLLLNFKVPRMKEGIYRVYNNFGKELI